MKTKSIILSIVFLLGYLSLIGQNKDPKCSFDVTKFKADRAEYFTKELELTPEQVEAFLPLLDEFMTKKFRVNKESRIKAYELKRKENKTDADYEQATEAYLEAKIKEAELQKEYYKRFGTFLSPKQVYKFSPVEISFMRKVVNRSMKKRNDNQNHKIK